MANISHLMLGGNVGNRLGYLRLCIDFLHRDIGRVVTVSSVYESEPWGFNDPCWFLNQVAVVETSLAPLTLLEYTQRIEYTLGRLRLHNDYHARTMDIDILLYGNQIINMRGLVIPHPRMAERMFVLQPMAELAPDLAHPVLRCTMKCLREKCTDRKQVKVYEENHE